MRESRKNLRMIAERVDRIARIARIARTGRNLVGFTRQREGREHGVPATVLIRTVAALSHGRMRSRGIYFICAIPDDLPAVHGDNVQRQIVLINLLENALQALSTGCHCHVRAAVHQQCLEIEVQDLGPDPEWLFTAFFLSQG